MTAVELIETIASSGADKKGILDALCDGSILEGVDQDVVEQAYDMVKNSNLDEHIANGGTIGNYQW